MGLKKKEIEVPEAADALGEKLANFIKVLDQALEDGWQTGSDLPVILSAAVVELVPALSQFKAASEDLKAYPYESGKAIALHLADIVKACATKPNAPAPEPA